jgi:hypothetical protein
MTNFLPVGQVLTAQASSLLPAGIKEVVLKNSAAIFFKVLPANLVFPRASR